MTFLTNKPNFCFKCGQEFNQHSAQKISVNCYWWSYTLLDQFTQTWKKKKKKKKRKNRFCSYGYCKVTSIGLKVRVYKGWRKDRKRGRGWTKREEERPRLGKERGREAEAGQRERKRGRGWTKREERGRGWTKREEERPRLDKERGREAEAGQRERKRGRGWTKREEERPRLDKERGREAEAGQRERKTGWGWSKRWKRERGRKRSWG